MAMRKALAVLAISGTLITGTAAQPPWAREFLASLAWMERSVLEATYFCALAAVAPTLQDQRILALRVVNVLEGSKGPHFDPRLATEEMPGVLPRLQALWQSLGERELPPEDRQALNFSLENVRAFLTLALEAALRGARGRWLTRGAITMRQAYAYLLAALGPGDPKLAYLGGIRPLLLRYGPPPEAESP